GNLYLELPVDYPDHGDVPGFFSYVRGLSDVDFIFYLVGRFIGRDALPDLLRAKSPADALRDALADTDYAAWYGPYLDPIVANIPAFRERLVSAWEAYWISAFHREVAVFEPMWLAGIQEKRAMLAREGGRGLFEKVTGRVEIPSEFPADVPISSITLIPVCLLPSRVYLFYGYGNVTILFDPQYTEERQIAAQTRADEALATIKALDDRTRLDILRLIAQKGAGMHGKMIAERRGISASAVSRHLALLKDGKLIAEEPHKNLITYRFQKETLTDLVDSLLDYLYS
ncbi:MAG TPA: MarR family transcriptional regulator, partial [Aggregatilineales bacterium]|nr:MarR family transcriptional regulator [Aggregatilineales bacterium]